MTATVDPRMSPAPVPARTAQARRYVMCAPTYFDVTYSINPWMQPGVGVDRRRAVRQWNGLRETYERLGHRVDLLEPMDGLPDMVFAANGALVIDGRAFGARFAHPERRPEAALHGAWLRARVSTVHPAAEVNEGEGDFAVAGDLILAGTGFRTTVAAHQEAQEFFGRPVIALHLVDPRFYHLDTALAVLDERTLAWYPPAFSAGSQAVLRRLFPASIEASTADALAFGLNAVSDGLNVVLPAQAVGLAAALDEHGYRPVAVDVSELLKAGGSIKCMTMEWHR